MDYLSVKELAELKGCSERNIRDQIRKGKIYSEQVINDKNRHNCYAIPITALPEELQLKYYQRKRAENGVMPEPAAPKKQKVKRLLTFENCTAEQRKSINLWTTILQDWQGQREQYQKKTEFDHLYVAKCQLEHPELQISTDILYRKWSAYKENDFAGLLGLRGAWNRGSSTIPKPVWEAFLWYYLEENKPPLSRCYQSTLHWTELFYPELLGEIPSERSFRRHVENDIAKAVKELTRNGNKAFADRCMPYIMRMYDDLKPNDVWIADNHTLDIQTVDSSGERHRLYLTAFQDAKSGVIVGWNITETVDSQSTILALRHGILRFGIPKAVYFDNGHEFTTFDLGGKGNRKRKSDAEKNSPTTILNRLQIEVHNAIVCNAKAKPIERTFRTVKEHFSRATAGFCGGNAVLGKQGVGSRKFGHVVVGRSGHGNDLAHAGRKFVNGGFTCVLRGNQHIADFGCILGAQLIAIDGRRHNINGLCGIGKAAFRQLDSRRGEINCIGSVHTGGNGAVHGFGKIVDGNARFVAGGHDVRLVRFKIGC